MSKRRNPFETPDPAVITPPSIYESLRVASPRKRNRQWEKEHQSQKAIYRGVDPKLALKVKSIADDLVVPTGEVARALIEFALRAYAEGDLDLNPRPNPYRMQQTMSFVDEYYHGLPTFPQPVIWDAELAGDILRLHHLLETQADTLAQESFFVWTIGRLLQRYAISQPPRRRLRPEHPAVRRVQTYLADHYAEPVALGQLSQLTQLSPFHLLRVFQAQVGMPPHQYLIQLRVMQAKSLLTAQVPPAMVASELGFVDQTHFSRQFKRIVGVPPGQFAPQPQFYTRLLHEQSLNLGR